MDGTCVARCGPLASICSKAGHALAFVVVPGDREASDACAGAALELDRPQPLLRMHVAEPEESIERVRRQDVRNGVGVAHDVDRTGEPRHRLVLAVVGQRPPHRQVAARAGEDDEGNQGKSDPSENAAHAKLIATRIADC